MAAKVWLETLALALPGTHHRVYPVISRLICVSEAIAAVVTEWQPREISVQIFGH
jgi:hypothetical protein